MNTSNRPLLLYRIQIGDHTMRLTRRDLGRLAIAGAASTLAPAQDPDRPFRYCIVGLGRISMQHFMPGAKLSKYSRVTALVSGHRDKADKVAAEYGVPAKNIYSYANYDAIAGNPEIDAVYMRCRMACMPSTQSARPRPASTCSAR